MSKRKLILWDERAAADGNTDDDGLAILDWPDSREDAQGYVDLHGFPAALFSYVENGDELLDERFEGLLMPAPRERAR